MYSLYRLHRYMLNYFSWKLFIVSSSPFYSLFLYLFLPSSTTLQQGNTPHQMHSTAYDTNLSPCSHIMFLSLFWTMASFIYYLPQTNLLEGHIFTGVCASVELEGVAIPACLPPALYKQLYCWWVSVGEKAAYR